MFIRTKFVCTYMFHLLCSYSINNDFVAVDIIIFSLGIVFIIFLLVSHYSSYFMLEATAYITVDWKHVFINNTKQ